jgi:hypothetical protein
MTKLLNLNQLSAKETREVQIGSQTYVVREMSVEDFIETTRVAEAMENETSYAKQLTATIDLIKRSIPNIETSVLMSLSLEQLKGLAAFTRGETPESIVGAHEAQGATKDEAGNV